ncbi:hypothetical protein GFD24_02820 [Bifidobacterium ramosum]|uniref:Uncharacterized protein n=1 Tax=Bifidobacterium ramosum TaxID=1798158 RepID=A0A7K3T9E0_9BIFI|nr:hypothetical protein [Bifidobacterium ramosum]
MVSLTMVLLVNVVLCPTGLIDDHHARASRPGMTIGCHSCLRGRWPALINDRSPRYHLACRTFLADRRPLEFRLCRADPVGSTGRGACGRAPFFRRLPADNGSLPDNVAYRSTTGSPVPGIGRLHPGNRKPHIIEQAWHRVSRDAKPVVVHMNTGRFPGLSSADPGNRKTTANHPSSRSPRARPPWRPCRRSAP